MILFHYTKGFWLPSILLHRALWPSPTLRTYGLNREEVEKAPHLFGFRTGIVSGRRCFMNMDVPNPAPPGGLSSVNWFQGQVFDVALTRADWCYSVMSYFPEDLQEGGDFWRLRIKTDELNVAGWKDYQQRANIPAVARRELAEITRQAGDDPHDWYFFFGELPLDGHLVDIEQYHRGRWTPLADVFERVPLGEMPRERRLFEATSRRIGHATGLIGASLFTMVRQDGRLVADHLWAQQTWRHLKPGDCCRFIATVIPYTRRDRSKGWTLADVNGLEVVCNEG